MLEDDKKQRKARKSAFTRELNNARQHMAEGDRAEVDGKIPSLKAKFAEFERAHNAYHEQLTEENDIDASDTYFEEVQNNYIEGLLTLNKWLSTSVGKEEVKPGGNVEQKVETLSDNSETSTEFMTWVNLPQVEIPCFNGDPMTYHTFLSVFDERVHRTRLDATAKLTRLIQHTSEDARTAIEPCVLLGEAGYEEARKILQQRFGNDFVISDNVIKNIKSGKPVKSPKDLQKFCDELTRGKAILTSMGRLNEIDTQSSIVDIVCRLQPYLRNRWKRQAMECKREKQRYPGFGDLVNFVMTEAEEATDPVYGSLGQSNKHIDNKSHGQSFKSSGQSSTSLQTTTAPSLNHQASKSAATTKFPAAVCVVCRGPRHRLFGCEQFKGLRPSDRLDLVRRHKLCENCLMDNHTTEQCRKPSVCTVPGCGLKHTKFIHVDPPANVRSNVSDSVNVCQAKAVANFSDCSNVMLPIVKVCVNDLTDTNALLDSGSNSSFCTEKLVRELQLQGRPVNYSLKTLGVQQENRKSMVVDLNLRSYECDSTMQLCNVYVIPEIPVEVPSVDLQKHSHLQDLSLHIDGQVDILIGQCHAEALIPLEVRKGNRGDPFAVRTLLGWSVNGPVAATDRCSRKVISNFVTSSPISMSSLDSDIKRLWDIEGEDLYSEELSWSREDKDVIDFWDQRHKLVDGHYQVPIPWKPGTQFPNNYGMAASRLESLRRNLDKRGLTERYEAEMEKLLDKGYAEEVPRAPVNGLHKLWYLPHQPVLNDKKPDKLRLVFDCAAKFRGQSLNDKAYQGPDINNKLIDVLLRFRQHSCAVMADVEAMYNQVIIPEDDRDALRFLWVDKQGNKVQYRMTRHLFGGVWCACSATYCLRRVLHDNPDVPDIVRHSILKSFYVDDCLVSVPDENTALEVISGTKSVLATGGFNLTKFNANRQSIVEQIPVHDRAKETNQVKEFGEAQGKVLGIGWNMKKDTFFYKTDTSRLAGKTLTRRDILSYVASIYDPLGLVSPISITGRLLVQETSKLHLGWDDVIPSSLQQRWERWIMSLNDLHLFHVPRCIKPQMFDDAYMEIHHFGDASKDAYGSCSYLRCVNKSGEIHTALIMSKCRVAPLKNVTIPRLELQAAVLSVKSDCLLRKEMELDIINSYFWSDSKIVLSYIKNSSARFQVFVANRIALITDSSSADHWHHIQGELNPADLLTRGIQPRSVNMDFWLNGPEFLRTYKTNWPKQNIDFNLSSNDPEVKKDVCAACTATEDIHPIDVLSNYYSSWFELKRSVAWWLRIRAILLSKKRMACSSSLSVAEIRSAEVVILKHVQSQYYPEEVNKLTVGSSLKKGSSLTDLQPILDEDGVLRVGGRMKYADLDRSRKHPVIVPQKHRIATLVVQQAHEIAHLGTEWTLSVVRAKYWVVKARAVIRKVRQNCMKCRRIYRQPGYQQMAELPEERLTSGKPPFTVIGMDCFGPFLVKLGRSEVKRWGCIFTCLTTRAVHLEVVGKMDTDSFLNCFRRFQARRGTPEKIFCDNGTNFVGAKTELVRAMKQLDASRLEATFLREEIEWHFNPPHAPHMGGIWERMVGVVKRILPALLSTGRLTDEILETTFTEVESIVNGRPITKLSSQVDDPTPLTPNHLLLLRGGPVTPLDSSQGDMYRRRWKYVQHLANQFWTRWAKEYLPELQRRSKWKDKQENFKIGDLVMIVGENTPRNLWPLGIVSAAETGKDGLVRTVTVKTRSTVLTRPVTKVVKLEGDCELL